jgi:hypothetical protein
MTSLKEELNLLIAKYSIQNVNISLQARMKEDYEYLKTLYGKKEEPVKVKEEVKAEVKGEVKEEVKAEVKPEVKVEEEVKKENKNRDSKEMKIWQKEQEDKKRKENEDKGINIKDLLTKENLKKWIEEEGRTYSYIAREYVGCKDSEVSATAKAFGIENTRKNVLIKNTMKK